MSDTSDNDDIWGYTASKRHRKSRCTKTTDRVEAKSHKTRANKLKNCSRKTCDDRLGVQNVQIATTCIDSVIPSHLGEQKLLSMSQNDQCDSNVASSSNDGSGESRASKVLDAESFCPLCQVPFVAVKMSPNDHLAECLQAPSLPETECLHGINCEMRSADHFRTFCHTQLAQLRAGISTDRVTPEDHSSLVTSQGHSDDVLDDTVTVKESSSDSLSTEAVPMSIEEKRSLHSIDCDEPCNTVEILTQEEKHANTSVSLDEKSSSRIEEEKEEEEEVAAAESSSTFSPSQQNTSVISAPFNSACTGSHPLSISQSKDLHDCDTSTHATHQHTSTEHKPSHHMIQSSISAFFKLQRPVDKLPCPAVCTNMEVSHQKLGVSTIAAVNTRSTTSKSGNTHNGKWGNGWHGNSQHKTRKCPFYKWVSGTKFTVDAFSYGTIIGCSAYFLSHFHADHYGGLTKAFTYQLYCSKVTANLVKKKLGVSDTCITALSLDEPHMIDGVQVTLIDANHCPGSVLLLFRLADGRAQLHTGDFRADPSMERHPSLVDLKTQTLYLDTTYCDPAYSFPSQCDVIKQTVDLVTEHLRKQARCLVAVGSYTIGKERIFVAIADAVRSLICVTREKHSVLSCLDNSTMMKKLTFDPNEAQVHVLPMNKLNYHDLSQYISKLKPKFDKVLAISPTGWTHTKQTGTSTTALRLKLHRDNVTIYGVPYSEHSSCKELRRFVRFTRPQTILPTVNNGSETKRRQMAALFHEWLTDDSPDKSITSRQTALDVWLS